MRFADRAWHPSVTLDYKVSVNLTFQDVKCIEFIYLESLPTSVQAVETGWRSWKSRGHNLFSASPVRPSVGVESEWCTLVTDQANESPEGNGIDTAPSRKITKGGGGGKRAMSRLIQYFIF